MLAQKKSSEAQTHSVVAVSLNAEHEAKEVTGSAIDFESADGISSPATDSKDSEAIDLVKDTLELEVGKLVELQVLDEIPERAISSKLPQILPLQLIVVVEELILPQGGKYIEEHVLDMPIDVSILVKPNDMIDAKANLALAVCCAAGPFHDDGHTLDMEISSQVFDAMFPRELVATLHCHDRTIVSLPRAFGLHNSTWVDTGQGLHQEVIPLVYGTGNYSNEEAKSVANVATKVLGRISNMPIKTSGTRVLVLYPLRLLKCFTAKQVSRHVKVVEKDVEQFSIQDLFLVHVSPILQKLPLVPSHGDSPVNFFDSTDSVFVDNFVHGRHFGVGVPWWDVVLLVCLRVACCWLDTGQGPLQMRDDDFCAYAACLELVYMLHGQSGRDIIPVTFCNSYCLTNFAVIWLSPIPKFNMAGGISSIMKSVHASFVSVAFESLAWDKEVALIIKQPSQDGLQLDLLNCSVLIGHATLPHKILLKLDQFDIAVEFILGVAVGFEAGNTKEYSAATAYHLRSS